MRDSGDRLFCPCALGLKEESRSLQRNALAVKFSIVNPGTTCGGHQGDRVPGLAARCEYYDTPRHRHWLNLAESETPAGYPAFLIQ